jgi:hypothetical protein
MGMKAAQERIRKREGGVIWQENNPNAQKSDRERMTYV